MRHIARPTFGSSLDSAAVINVVTRQEGSLVGRASVGKRLGRQYRGQMLQHSCALRTNRHESLSEAAKMTEVIATEASKCELTNCFGHIDGSTETARDSFANRTWGKPPSALVFSPLNSPGIVR